MKEVIYNLIKSGQCSECEMDEFLNTPEIFGIKINKRDTGSFLALNEIRYHNRLKENKEILGMENLLENLKLVKTVEIIIVSIFYKGLIVNEIFNTHRERYVLALDLDMNNLLGIVCFDKETGKILTSVID